jgi:hypothetical protein
MAFPLGEYGERLMGRPVRLGLFLLGLGALLNVTAPSASASTRDEPKQEEGKKDTDGAAASTPDRLGPMLGKSIRGEAPLDDVEIDVLWSTGALGIDSGRIYGDGVVICNDSLQFSVKKETVLSILEALRKARFGSMPPSYGEASEDVRGEASRGGEDEGPRLRGRIEVRAGSITKTVQQFWNGPRSAELEALAREILGVCRDPAPEGTRVATVVEGLEKLDSRSLASEALQVTLRRRADGEDAAADASWILKLDGRRVTDQLLPAGHTPRPPKLLVLSEADFQTVVRLLAEARITEIPTYVYQTQYTELRVTVLNRMRLITGRKVRNLTAETLAKQKAFDRVYGALHALHERVQKKGKTIAAESREMNKEIERERKREQKEKD